MKTVGGTDYTNYAPRKCCGQTDGRTDQRTNGRTDGRSGPTTRPAFAKATQVKKRYNKSYNNDTDVWHYSQRTYNLAKTDGWGKNSCLPERLPFGG